MANDGLIAAALSAFTGKNIVSYDEYLRRRDKGGIQWVAIDNDNLASMCYDVEVPPMTQEPAIDEVVTPVTTEQSVKVAIPNTTDEVVNVTVTGDSTDQRLTATKTIPHTGDVEVKKKVTTTTTKINGAERVETKTGITSTKRTMKPLPIGQQIVFVKGMDGQTSSIQLGQNATIAELKRLYSEKVGIPIEQLRLSFGAKPLQDENTLSTYHIGHESTVHAVPSIVGGGPGIPIVFYLSADFLHPRFDYDFTNLKDNADGNHRRGGYTYRRPCGWHRYGIRVNGKYGDDRWLGSNPDSDAVWPVSYHGTTKEAAASITNTGYDVSKGKRFRFGKGVYSTPLVSYAGRYATPFVYNGVKYKMVLQNRVNSKAMTVHHLPESPGIEEWVSRSDRDTRPYGVLIRRA